MYKTIVVILAILCLSFDADKAADYVWRVEQDSARCSGVAVTHGGKNYIVTAWHCVDKGTPVFVDGKPVEVVSFNIMRDIAVLSAPSHLKRFATVQPKLPATGTRVYVYGFPASMFLLSEGIISGQCGQFQNMRVFPITAHIWHGSSGGPVLDDNGQVLGIVSFMYPDGKFSWSVCGSEIVSLLNGLK